jgi:hypothetical protein
MKLPSFVGGSYETRAVPMDPERTINFYVERMESPGATSYVRVCTLPHSGHDRA